MQGSRKKKLTTPSKRLRNCGVGTICLFLTSTRKRFLRLKDRLSIRNPSLPCGSSGTSSARPARKAERPCRPPRRGRAAASCTSGQALGTAGKMPALLASLPALCHPVEKTMGGEINQERHQHQINDQISPARHGVLLVKEKPTSPVHILLGPPEKI